MRKAALHKGLSKECRQQAAPAAVLLPSVIHLPCTEPAHSHCGEAGLFTADAMRTERGSSPQIDAEQNAAAPSLCVICVVTCVSARGSAGVAHSVTRSSTWHPVGSLSAGRGQCSMTHLILELQCSGRAAKHPNPEPVQSWWQHPLPGCSASKASR